MYVLIESNRIKSNRIESTFPQKEQQAKLEWETKARFQLQQRSTEEMHAASTDATLLQHETAKTSLQPHFATGQTYTPKSLLFYLTSTAEIADIAKIAEIAEIEFQYATLHRRKPGMTTVSLLAVSQSSYLQQHSPLQRHVATHTISQQWR